MAFEIQPELRAVHDDLGASFRADGLVEAYGRGPSAEAFEYEAATKGVAVVDLCERSLLEVTGPVRAKFLQGMLSNDVESLLPGAGRLAALLDVRGHVLSLLRVLVSDDAIALEGLAQRLTAVQDALEHHRVAAPVRFRPRPTAVLGVLGTAAPEWFARRMSKTPPQASEGHASMEIGGVAVRAARATDLPGVGYVLHVSPESAGDLWRHLMDAGAQPVGRNTIDALRIEGKTPWFGFDVTEENLLHEAGVVERYCSFTKGCYIGQEIVARLHARGENVSRRLCTLRLGSAVEPGTRLTHEGKEVGRITTSATSARLGPIALAYVHRQHHAEGSSLRAGEVEAIVSALPPAEVEAGA